MYSTQHQLVYIFLRKKKSETIQQKNQLEKQDKDETNKNKKKLKEKG